jgi:hypothetical protein
MYNFPEKRTGFLRTYKEPGEADHDAVARCGTGCSELRDPEREAGRIGLDH